MTDFDYGNARLRARKARLLSQDALVGFAGMGTVENLLAALNETSYRPAVEAALIRASSLAALADALRRDLVSTLSGVRDFYRGSAAEQVGLLLRQYDVFNVKTILRGVSRGVPPAAIVEQTLPAGALAPGALVDLARAESTAAVVSLLATWRSPLAAPLLALLAEQPQASLAERERALDRWWSRAAWQASAAPAWRENLVEQIDSENIMVALRFVGVPLDAERLSAQFLALPEAGNALLAPTILLDAALAPDIRTAVARLASTSYAPTLNDALGDYSRRGRRSEFEIALARRRLQRAARLFHQDPLGIGVPLGYTILKRSEVRNLRLVGHGLFLGDPPERIVERLVTA